MSKLERIQSGQRLTTRPVRNSAYKVVTAYMKPEERRLSATTQVKEMSPEMPIIALGQGFYFPETRTAVCVRGEYTVGVPGSESVAGNRTVHVGTWESRTVSRKNALQAGEASRSRSGAAVGLTHSRGVSGVMAGEDANPLEGVSGIMQRDEEAYAIH